MVIELRRKRENICYNSLLARCFVNLALIILYHAFLSIYFNVFKRVGSAFLNFIGKIVIFLC